jgi:hypothetical protein
LLTFVLYLFYKTNIKKTDIIDFSPKMEKPCDMEVNLEAIQRVLDGKNTTELII